MYNYNGIVFRILAVGGIIFCIGLFLLILCLIKKPSTHLFKSILPSIAIIAFSLLYCGYMVYVLINPSIKLHTGYFSRQYRDPRVAPPLPVTFAYVFSNGDSLKPTFYLDNFSKKSIYSKNFDPNIMYKIYYEERTDIIIKVEEMSD